MRRRTYNLSSRLDLQPSESIVAGVPFSGSYEPSLDELPEISLEKRFAQRVGVELGDTMTFRIEGVDIQAKVVNLRKVKWTSFEPNFFVYFQPGVIDEAPKSFIASIYNVDPKFLERFQRAFTAAFANIPVINVGELIRQMTTFLTEIARLIWLVTLISGVSSLTILYAINLYRRKSYQEEFTKMQILGLKPHRFRWFYAIEYPGASQPRLYIRACD